MKITCNSGRLPIRSAAKRLARVVPPRSRRATRCISIAAAACLVVLACFFYMLRIRGAAGSLAWHFTYDDDGRATKTVLPGGMTTRITYEPGENGNPRRVVKRLPGGSEVVFEFDRFGRRTSMKDAAGVVRYEYDGFNRLTKVERNGHQPLHYSYDTLGRIKKLDLGSSRHVEYVYDFLGRVSRIETPAGAISYDYQLGAGRVIRTLPNGVRLISESHPDGRLAALIHVDSSGRVLMQLTYSYRADGLIESVKEFAGGRERQVNYGYDIVQRLSSVEDSRGSSASFRYDKLGNVTEVISSGPNRIASTYDWAGRLLTHEGRIVSPGSSSTSATSVP